MDGMARWIKKKRGKMMTMKLHQAKVTLPTSYWFIKLGRVFIVSPAAPYLRSHIFFFFNIFNFLTFYSAMEPRISDPILRYSLLCSLVASHMHETDPNVSSVPLRKPVSLNPLQIRGLDNLSIQISLCRMVYAVLNSVENLVHNPRIGVG